MLVVEELYKESVENTSRKLIIFNGELDRIRSGCILRIILKLRCSFYYIFPVFFFFLMSEDYPPFFYPKLAALTKSFLPKLEAAYYVHNFKGSKGGTLFR